MTECLIEGSVSVTNKELMEAIKEHNALVKHQNTILSKLVDVLKEVSNESSR